MPNVPLPPPSRLSPLPPSSLQEAIKVVQPLLLWKIIQYFESYEPSDQRSLVAVYCYAAALSLSAFALTILQHVYYYLVLRTGMKMRVAVCHLIYGKVSRSLNRDTHSAVFCCAFVEVSKKCDGEKDVLCPPGAESQQRVNGPHDDGANC